MAQKQTKNKENPVKNAKVSKNQPNTRQEQNVLKNNEVDVQKEVKELKQMVKLLKKQVKQKRNPSVKNSSDSDEKNEKPQSSGLHKLKKKLTNKFQKHQSKNKKQKENQKVQKEEEKMKEKNVEKVKETEKQEKKVNSQKKLENEFKLEEEDRIEMQKSKLSKNLSTKSSVIDVPVNQIQKELQLKRMQTENSIMNQNRMLKRLQCIKEKDEANKEQNAKNKDHLHSQQTEQPLSPKTPTSPLKEQNVIEKGINIWKRMNNNLKDQLMAKNLKTQEITENIIEQIGINKIGKIAQDFSSSFNEKLEDQLKKVTNIIPSQLNIFKTQQKEQEQDKQTFIQTAEFANQKDRKNQQSKQQLQQGKQYSSKLKLEIGNQISETSDMSNKVHTVEFIDSNLPSSEENSPQNVSQNSQRFSPRNSHMQQPKLVFDSNSNTPESRNHSISPFDQDVQEASFGVQTAEQFQSIKFQKHVSFGGTTYIESPSKNKESLEENNLEEEVQQIKNVLEGRNFSSTYIFPQEIISQDHKHLKKRSKEQSYLHASSFNASSAQQIIFQEFESEDFQQTFDPQNLEATFQNYRQNLNSEIDSITQQTEEVQEIHMEFEEQQIVKKVKNQKGVQLLGQNVQKNQNQANHQDQEINEFYFSEELNSTKKDSNVKQQNKLNIEQTHEKTQEKKDKKVNQKEERYQEQVVEVIEEKKELNKTIQKVSQQKQQSKEQNPFQAQQISFQNYNEIQKQDSNSEQEDSSQRQQMEQSLKLSKQKQTDKVEIQTSQEYKFEEQQNRGKKEVQQLHDNSSTKNKKENQKQIEENITSEILIEDQIQTRKNQQKQDSEDNQSQQSQQSNQRKTSVLSSKDSQNLLKKSQSYQIFQEQIEESTFIQSEKF